MKTPLATSRLKTLADDWVLVFPKGSEKIVAGKKSDSGDTPLLMAEFGLQKDQGVLKLAKDSLKERLGM